MTDTLDSRVQRAEGYLARFKDETLGGFVGGSAVAASGEAFDNLCPVDNSVLGTVATT